MTKMLAAAVAALLIAAAPASATPTTPSWVATWGLPINSSKTTSFTNRTIRVVAQTTLGGAQVRVRLSNDNGTQPITLSDAHVGLAGSGAAITGANVPLTFAGAASVTIAAGASLMSDPATLAVPDGATLAVSVFSSGATGRGTGDNEISSYYAATGDHAADTASTSFGAKAAGGWFVTGIDVYTPNDGAIVGFGDSITAGYNAGGVGWPVYLGQSLDALAAAGGPRVSVVDMGISGNEVTRDRAGYGVSALNRWQRDALDVTGVRTVLMMEGINDLGADAVPAASIESAYQTLEAQARAAGVRLLVSPLTPAGDAAAPASQYGGDYSTAKGLQIRHDFDDWLRTTDLYDPILDFAAVVQNAADPDEMAPAYDSGDHLHPGTSGQHAMADSVKAIGGAVTTASTTAGGTVPATLALTLGGAASFGTFTPGVAKTYDASTTADVVSTAGDAALSWSGSDHLTNGTFTLPQPFTVDLSTSSWSAPVSHGAVTIGFHQPIAANDALRTGTYSAAVTFTLSTTSP